jgi:hypothetical protein
MYCGYEIAQDEVTAHEITHRHQRVSHLTQVRPFLAVGQTAMEGYHRQSVGRAEIVKSLAPAVTDKFPHEIRARRFRADNQICLLASHLIAIKRQFRVISCFTDNEW